MIVWNLADRIAYGGEHNRDDIGAAFRQFRRYLEDAPDEFISEMWAISIKFDQYRDGVSMLEMIECIDYNIEDLRRIMNRVEGDYYDTSELVWVAIKDHICARVNVIGCGRRGDSMNLHWIIVDSITRTPRITIASTEDEPVMRYPKSRAC
jgi:hypothetical protein